MRSYPMRSDPVAIRWRCVAIRSVATDPKRDDPMRGGGGTTPAARGTDAHAPQHAKECKQELERNTKGEVGGFRWPGVEAPAAKGEEQEEEHAHDDHERGHDHEAEQEHELGAPVALQLGVEQRFLGVRAPLPRRGCWSCPCCSSTAPCRKRRRQSPWPATIQMNS